MKRVQAAAKSNESGLDGPDVPGRRVELRGGEQVLEDFLGVLLMLGVAALLAALLLALPRRFSAESSGAEASPISARQRYATKFLLAAAFFAVLEFAVVLLVPWAVVFRELGSEGWVVAAVFVLPVAVGVHYQWRKGALEW